MDRWGLVGRERELAQLEALLAGAAAGRGALASVTGEAGIGKTRLVEALALSAGAGGHAVAWGRAWEAGGAPPLLPWQEIAAAVGFRWPGASVGDEYGEFRLYDAVAGGLAETSAAGPLLVILEDVHVADAGSIRLLAYIARRITTMRVTVVATWRDVEARLSDTADAILSSLRPDTHLHLGPLERGEHDRLLQQGRSAPIADETLAEIYTRSGGVPLHAKEVLSLIEAGSRRVPDTVTRTTTHRLTALSDGARHLLHTAAMVGREFDPAIVAAAAQVPVERALSLLGEGAAVGILERAPGGGFRFSHALVRDAIDDALDPAARAAGHLAVATALERDGRAPAATIVHHYAQAVALAGRAVVSEWAARAAMEARASMAHDLAVEFSDLALAHMPEPRDPAAEASLLLARGAARVTAADLENARTDFRAALDVAQRAGSPPLIARAALGMASAAGMGSFIGESATTDPERANALRMALAAQPAGDSPERVELCARLGTELWGDFDAAAERDALLDEALEMADRDGDPRLMARARVADFIIRMYEKGPDHVARVATEVEALALRTGDLDVTAGLHYVRFIHAVARGDVAAARRALVAHGALANRYGIPLEQWRYRSHLATLELISGSLDTAEQAIEDAFELSATAAPPLTAMVVYVTQTGMILRRRGTVESLRELERQMLDANVALPALTSPLVGAALCAFWLGDEETARVRTEAALDASSRLNRGTNWLVTTAMAAELLSLAGDLDICRRLLAELEPWSGWGQEVGTGLDLMGPVDRSLAMLNARLGRWENAERLIDSARGFDARTANWSSECLTEMRWAEALLRWGGASHRKKAYDSLDRVERVSTAHGAPDFLAKAIAALRAGSKGATRSPGSPPAPEAASLRVEGSVWVVEYRGAVARVERARGMAALATLVGAPGREFHVLDLADAAVEQHDLGPQVDTTARRSYLRRAEELRDELASAERDADLGRIDKIRDELEFIAAELSGSVDRHGRARPTGATAERARVATTKAVRAAIVRVAEHFPDLGGHLQSAVRTGTYCRYDPDPTAPISWVVHT